MKNEGRIVKTRIRERGQITLPSAVREFLEIEVGDDLFFRLDEEGRVVIERAHIVPPDQVWFWTERWQRMERQVQEDIDSGRILRYSNIDDALKDLEQSNDDGN